MSIPTTREQFAQWCLRKLGGGVLQINISEEQVDDRIDEALYYYAQYHMEGSEKTYYKYPLTNTDIANGYITLPANIIGAVRIFPVGQSIGTNSLFNMRYQFVMNDLYNFSNVSLVPYYMAMNHIQFIEEMLIGQKPIRYNRHNNILYLDMDMTTVVSGEWLVVEAYMIIDPLVYPDVWKDRYLQEYTTALLRRQWGENLKLFNAPLPGGIILNGKELFEEGDAEVKRLEAEMIRSYSLPPALMIA